MMHRNLDRRVEALLRIKDPAHLAELAELLELSMDPGTVVLAPRPGRHLDPARTGPDGEPLRDLQAHLIATRPAGGRRGPPGRWTAG